MIRKRNGKTVAFDFEKIRSAVQRTFKASGYKEIPKEFMDELESENFERFSTVEEIQDRIEKLLYYSGFRIVYNNFVTYRANHALMRESKNKVVFDSIINTEKNDITRDNGNMNADSPAGQMMKFASETTKPFVEKYMLADDVIEYMKDNYLYIHDKDYYPTRSLTCLQHPLDRILDTGFMAGHGEARPAKRIETAAILAAISMETIQNEMHGGQAIPAFDFYMAPYVRLTYKEEVEKIREFLECSNKVSKTYWEEIKNEIFDDYIERPLNEKMKHRDKIIQQAMNATVRRVHQAMESFIHNMNSIHSRGGNQVVFSSINYGTDTSAEGRCIIRELLLSTERGVGNNATAIFPIQIWKMKSGVSFNPGDPNYDLYKLSWRVSARRFFPNYLNLDSSYNTDDAWDENDPKRYEHEVATMGCRTRVYENRFGPKTSIGRGNLSFSTINLPKIAIEVAIETGYLTKTETGYKANVFKNSNDEILQRVGMFWTRLEEMIEITAKQLDNRYQFQKHALAKQFPLLMSGMWNGSKELKGNDIIEPVLNQGTLGIGFIGLAEALIALTGKHHGESDASQKIGLKTLEIMNEICNNMCTKYKHNYAILATPAEGLSGYFTKFDKKQFGEIKGITDKDYYTNSNHVPVYYKCTPQKKAEIECPYHKLTKGGHIFYVEADADITKNPSVIGQINKMAVANDGGYISINHNQARCPHCNYESNTNDKIKICPRCGETMDQLSRITGYLVSTTDRWNSGKKAELEDRIIHT